MSGRGLLAYVVAVDVAAASALLLLRQAHTGEPWVGTFLLVTLIAFAGATPVRLPGLRTTVSATDPFVFTALAAYGALPACLVALAGIAGSALGRERTLQARHLAFNAGNVTVSTAGAALAYLASGGTPGGAASAQVAPLLAAASVYFLTNTGLVTGAIVLDTGQPFLPTWRRSVLWSAVSAYGGLTLAAGLLWLLDRVGPTGLALGVPPCWLLAAFYRMHRERQQEQQRRIRRVEELNVALEDKVAERTSELSQALRQLEAANASLRLANERLTEAIRVKTEFLARVSHELRTPLNAIIGFSDLLRDPSSGGLNREQSEFVDDIQHSGEHLLRLINQILDVSKLEAGRMELHLQPTDIDLATRESAGMLRAQAVQRGVALDVACAGDARMARVDPGMFRQVLVNLIGNAVKFTPPGGDVRVRAHADGRDLIAEVADTGIGIAADDVPRLFDDFFQVDGSYARSYGGTGLGLSIVRRMVELHGGRIEVETAPGRGSHFRARFPASLLDAAPPPTPAESPGARAVRATGTILVVDDHAVQRKLARNVLRARGWRVLEAASGEDALRLVRREPVDLVLIALELPGLDGLETTRRLKSDPRLGALPVVALIASDDAGEEERARAAGCVGTIPKPIRLAEFPGQVAAQLEAAATRAV